MSVFAFSYIFCQILLELQPPLCVKSKGILLQVFYRVFVHLFVEVCGFGDLSSSNSLVVLLGFFTMMIEQAVSCHSYTISTSVIKPGMLLALLYKRRKEF